MEQLHQLPLFSTIAIEQLAEWLARTPHRKAHYQRGERIVSQDEPCRSVYMLTQGTTRMEMGEQGRGLTIDHLQAPEVLASAFIFGSVSRFPVTVLAESDCTLWIVSMEAFFELMLAHPAAMRSFLQDISDRCDFLSRKVRSFALKSLRVRTLEFLAEKGCIESVQDAAQAMGVQRPSLSRMLSDLTAEGIVVRSERGLVLRR